MKSEADLIKKILNAYTKKLSTIFYFYSKTCEIKQRAIIEIKTTSDNISYKNPKASIKSWGIQKNQILMNLFIICFRVC